MNKIISTFIFIISHIIPFTIFLLNYKTENAKRKEILNPAFKEIEETMKMFPVGSIIVPQGEDTKFRVDKYLFDDSTFYVHTHTLDDNNQFYCFFVTNLKYYRFRVVK